MVLVTLCQQQLDCLSPSSDSFVQGRASFLQDYQFCAREKELVLDTSIHPEYHATGVGIGLESATMGDYTCFLSSNIISGLYTHRKR